MSSQPVVSFRKVSFAYDRVPVLEDVSFTVGCGEAVCVVGPNGGGKTTLARLILGLIRPGAGEVRVFGRRPEQSRLRIGYMPQHLSYDARFPVNVMDIVLTGRLGRASLPGRLGWYTAPDRRIAAEALAEVGLEGCGRRSLRSLSGGQRQRVLIARALCCRPDLLLLDEPTASLDTPGGVRLFEILRRLQHRMTVLIISHDVGFVTQLAESVVCVNRRVVVHPAKQLDGRAIHELYEGDVRMVQHADHIRQEDNPQGPQNPVADEDENGAEEDGNV